MELWELVFWLPIALAVAVLLVSVVRSWWKDRHDGNA